jgi:hypothetical protein
MQALGCEVDAECSPAVQRKVVAAATRCPSYASASEMLQELAGLHVSAKQCARVTQRIGAERVAQRQARVQAYESLPLPQQRRPPADAPANAWKGRVAAVLVDGGRAQLRDERWGQPPSPGERRSWWREPKAASLITFASCELDRDPHPEIPACLLDPLWVVPRLQELKRNVKAGTQQDPAASEASGSPAAAATTTAKKNKKKPPRWSPPPLVRSVVATFGSYEQLGRLARVEAYHRNFPQAQRKAFLGDGHLANWGLWEREFPDYVPIADLLHILSYVYQAARESTPDMPACWERYSAWARWVWQGRVSELLPELEALVAAAGDQTRDALQEALAYLTHNAPRMRYDVYRRQGLPITTALMESTVKQLNRRMKGTEKFWEEGAEPQLQLCADRLSDTQPLNQFWTHRASTLTGFRKPRAPTR